MTIKIFFKRRTHKYYIVVNHGRFKFTAISNDFTDALLNMYNELLLWDVTGYESALFCTTVNLDFGIIL